MNKEAIELIRAFLALAGVLRTRGIASAELIALQNARTAAGEDFTDEDIQNAIDAEKRRLSLA